MRGGPLCWHARGGVVLATGLISLSLTTPCAAERDPDERSHPRPPPQQQVGPWNRDLLLFVSADGQAFRSRGVFVERGGVPTAVATSDGQLVAAFQWFPFDRIEAFDRIAVCFSDDGGDTWTDPRSIVLDGLPESLRRAFDPALVILEDGRFRLYFASNRGRGHGPGDRAIFSAISSDAIRYTFEPGQRFGLEDRETFDPTVAKLGDTWHLYCPMPAVPGRGYHATSTDGLRFTRQPDVEIPGPRQWLGGVIAAEDGLRFYGSGTSGRDAGGWMATSPDGVTWTLAPGTRVPGADPGVALAPDGTTILITTGELRSDTQPGPPPFSLELRR